MIEDVWLKLIQEKVREHLSIKDFKVFIFGSRAINNNLRYSDVDIGIIGKERVKGTILEKIREALENSSLPYRVDVVDFQKVSPDFKEAAQKTIINL